MVHKVSMGVITKTKKSYAYTSTERLVAKRYF